MSANVARKDEKMKKPSTNNETKYPVNKECDYYGNCESGNNSCSSCNSQSNNTGSGNGSGNTIW